MANQSHNVEHAASKEYWSAYWGSKEKSLYQPVRESYLFADMFNKYLPKGGQYSFLEIGGFPGFFSIYFRKYFGFAVSLLDYHIDKKIIDKLSAINHLDSDITIIEADLFRYNSDAKYDIVFSSGFIEHFDDTQQIVKRHLDLAKNNGYVVIGLPNFRGLNGLLQKIFDPDNLRAHNLECMDVHYLKDILLKNNIEVLYADYYGKFGLWLERQERDGFLRLFLRAGNVAGRMLSAQKESRYFSPHILLIGKKHEKDNR